LAATDHIPLSEDAALVTALAGTAMAFSHCAEDEAERWLRALRLHGQVGSALQALGVGEAPLESDAADDACEEPTSHPPLGEPALDRTVREAERRAVERHAEAVGTADLLLALLDVYGDPMDQALESRGATRDEVIERLVAMGDHPELARARAPRSGDGS
jgi:ATP-dependent Clp protease ATP-binding subunit ClpA